MLYDFDSFPYAFSLLRFSAAYSLAFCSANPAPFPAAFAYMRMLFPGPSFKKPCRFCPPDRPGRY